MFAGVSQASTPAANVTVALSPGYIAANGTSSTTATATVTDATGNPVPGDAVSFRSSDSGETVSPAIDNGDGTYTATITSSTTAQPATITATDSSPAPSVSGSAILVQFNPAANVTVALSPSSIVANGSSHTSATATVTDGTGNRVPGDAVSFRSSDSGETVSPAIDNGDGTYTATITSSTTAQPATITATDSSTTPQPAGTSTLSQVAGPATALSVTLAPSSIKADNASTTTATALVTDAYGNTVSSDTVAFASSDGGVQTGSVTAHGNGTYTATLRASSTVGTPTITATDTSVTPSLSGAATLTQTAWSTTSVLAVPSAPVTNEAATLLATITSSSPSVAPSGTVTFTRGGVAINGCAALTIVPSGQSSTASCRTSFPASASNIAAVFTSNTASLSGSTSATAALQVGQDSTTSSLVILSPTVKTGTTDTYIAAVTPGHPGAVMPTGSVEFLDGGQPIPACAQQALANSSASSVAVCTVHYDAPGTHNVSVRYSGDGNFTASTSAAQGVSVQTPAVPILGTIAASMQWSFYVAPAGFTKVLQLKVKARLSGPQSS